MKPIAFSLGNITIHWYGIMMALAFYSALIIIQFRAKQKGFSVEKAADITFYAVISSIIGARLFYVLINFQDYMKNPLEIIRIDKGGLVFYGGIIATSFVIIYLCKKNKYDLALLADIFAPAISFGQMLGRIGCFMTGCCFGRKCTNFLAVQFPRDGLVQQIQMQKHTISMYATNPIPVYPVQLIASFSNFLIFLILIFLDYKKKLFKGQLFCIYLILYSSTRFLTEFLRGDYINMYGPFTIAQIICMIILPIGIIFYFKLNNKET